MSRFARSLVVVVACSFLAFAAAATEIPLSTSSTRIPSSGYQFVLGAVPAPDGDSFFTVWTELLDGGWFYVFGNVISRDGQPLTPRGKLLYRQEAGRLVYPQAVRFEDGHYVLRLRGARTEGGTTVYMATYVVIDLEGNVLSRTNSDSLEENWFWSPKNAAGETLALTTANGKTTLWFVGADGVRRHPMGFGRPIYPQVAAADRDHWIIATNYAPDPYVGDLPGATWYRFSEATRDTPQTKSVTYLGNWPPNTTWTNTFGVADGEAAVLTEERSLDRNNFDRTVWLNVFHRDGTVTKFTLLPKETILRAPSSEKGSAAVSKDGDSWISAYSWYDAAGNQALRIWKTDGDRVSETKREQAISHNDYGDIVQTLAVGTRNLLLFKPPRAATPYAMHALHAAVFDRGTSFVQPQGVSAVCSTPAGQDTPAAAAGADGATFTAWREFGGAVKAMVRLIDAAGNAGPATVLSTDGWAAVTINLARSGNTYVALWQEVLYDDRSDVIAQRVAMRRFDAHGTAIDTQPVALLSGRDYGESLSIAAEPGGFRLAWVGRGPGADDFHKRLSIYSAHLDAENGTLVGKDLLVPSWIESSVPITVSDGNEALVLWNEDPTVSGGGVRGQRYTNGVKGKGIITFASAISFHAAMHDGELLLASTRKEDTQTCTDAQRFALNGASLSAPIALGCSENPTSLFTLWSRDRWWVQSSASATTLHALDANGAAADVVSFFPDDMRPHAISFVPTSRGPAAVYTRAGADTEYIGHAFLRTLPKPKARAARP